MMAEAIAKAGYRKIGFLGTKLSMDHRARKRLRLKLGEPEGGAR